MLLQLLCKKTLIKIHISKLRKQGCNMSIQISKEQAHEIALAIADDIDKYINEHIEQYYAFLEIDDKEGDDA